MPGGGTIPATAGPPPEDLTKIVEELKAAASGTPAFPPTAGAAAPGGNKDVTVAGDTPMMGVRYWVEVVDARGGQRRATSDQVFRAGDRIRLHVTSNRDGYLTLVNLGSSGRTTVLFPQASAGSTNFVKAGTDYAVPPGTYLRFDETPGEETLVLALSPVPAPVPNAATALKMSQGAKDLVTEVDSTSPQPATYAVGPVRADAGSIAIQIKLTHR
jgi:hypothetical protein